MSATETRTKRNDEIYPPHLLAQKLSNRASYLILTRYYNESITLLTKALRLSQKHNPTGLDSQSCASTFCSLDSSVGMEENQYQSILNREHEEYCNNQNNVVRHSSSQQEQDELQINSENQDGFVYSRPLLVPKVCIEEGHYMGKPSTLIIMYNLALAHHLKAIAMNDSQSSCSLLEGYSMKVIKQALKLYELTYQLHCENTCELEQHPKLQCNQEESIEQSVTSLRFTMIISNNLGQIHRAAGNTEKHQMCLQHLLSTIMYMVDSQIIILHSSEMDGFYQNVSPLMVPANCARAA